MPACSHEWDSTTCICIKCGVSRLLHESLLMAEAKKQGIQSIDATKLRVEVERLREALDFYADHDSWERPEKAQTRTERTAHGQVTRCGRWSPVELDAGQRARKALERA